MNKSLIGECANKKSEDNNILCLMLKGVFYCGKGMFFCGKSIVFVENLLFFPLQVFKTSVFWCC